jgi:hypothetical protein
MRKIIASASLAALSAAGVHTAYAQAFSTMDQSKPWSVGLAVRGFYDDNYTTSPSDVSRDSWGISVSPTASINKVWDQTSLGLSYTYEMRWYEDRESNEADHIQSARLAIDHRFNESMDVKVHNTFYYGQEGTVELGPVTTPTVLQTDADYFWNRALAEFNADLSETAGIRVAYQNDFYDYDQSGVGSRSALLDRMEHLATVEGLWHFRPDTSGLLGYQYRGVDYRSSDSITPLADIDPENRNSSGHRFYVGAEHQASDTVQLGIRAGAEFTEYPDADQIMALGVVDDDSQTTPFVDARATWTYNPGSYLQLGVVHTLNATDVLALNQQSTAVWGLVNHRITPRLNGMLIGQFQHSSYNEGDYDGDTDLLYLLGVNFAYELNPYLDLEAGYNYDKLDSDLGGRSYNRSRVYAGVRASY